jgi:FlaA1/EpsC-like NDP-sugar epimerase
MRNEAVMEHAVRRSPGPADSPGGRRPPRLRTVAEPLVDVASWSASLVVVALLREGSTAPADFWSRAALIVGLAVGAQLTVGFSTDLYRASWRVGSIEEAAVLVRAVLVVTVVVVVTDVLADMPLPITAVVGGSALTLLVASMARSLWRLGQDRTAGRPGGP